MATATARRRTTGTGNGAGNGDTVSGYFKKLFRENPALVRARDNQQVLEHFARDHGVPSPAQVPANVKNTLSNVKSIMRKQIGGGKRKRKRTPATTAAGMTYTAGGAPMMTFPVAGSAIPNVQIGDWLTIGQVMAKGRRTLNISLKL